MRPILPCAILALMIPLLTLMTSLLSSPGKAADLNSSASGSRLQISTWTIVAVDPTSGEVGVAGASCVPSTHVDAVAALVPGKGAAATQAAWNLRNRNTVFQLLQQGYAAEDIIQQVSDTAYDPDAATRQYGVVTFGGGTIRAAGFTGQENLAWAGDRQDLQAYVTVQGNILVSEAVVANALKAFLADSEPDQDTLPDRLMRALEAGSAAGGDSRCNSDQVLQTASSAFILAARGTDPPYAAKDIGITDAGAPNAPWLAISVVEPRFGPNPIDELKERYDAWRRAAAAPPRTVPSRSVLLGAGGILALALAALGLAWLKRRAARRRPCAGEKDDGNAAGP